MWEGGHLMKTYTIKDVLAAAKVRIPIKEKYTLADVLRAKHVLSDGSLHYYDRQHYLVARWLNRFLKPHNMAWAQGNFGYAKIVRLDDSKPLPKNWEEICAEAWKKSGDEFDRLWDAGKIKRPFFGGMVFEVPK
jgi:hypothetical protein